MNAQEAIKILNKELNELTDELIEESLYCQSGSINVSEDFQGRNQKREALLIILESTKTLQEIKDRALSYAFIKDIDCSNVELYDFSKWVFDKAEGFEVSE